MAVNQANIQAMSFLQKDRAPEADRVLQQALGLDPKNPFTLNNLGYAKEKEGEYEAALKYYSEAASLSSEEPVIVAMDPGWRGKPISEIASDNANNLRKLMSREESLPARVARLNLQGVSALNRNERSVARKDFQDAYKLDPHDAFTLNNMGYVAELDGDRETADFFYAKAQEAGSADQKVTVATRQNVEGMKLDEVASGNDQLVQQRMEVALSERRSRGGPVLLLRRDNTPVIDPERPPAPPPAAAPAPAPQSVIPPGGLMMPLPENEQPANTDNSATSLPSQPAATGSTTTTGSVNQPTNTNPISASATPNQPAGGTSGAPANGSQRSGGLLMPLPENQQPTNADHGPTPPTNASPGNETASPPSSPNSNSGENNGGLLMPLPDNQQPTNADHDPAAAPHTPANQNSITPH